MLKPFLFGFSLLLCNSVNAQIIGGRDDSEPTPQVSKPTTISSGVYSSDVNLFTGDYNSSLNLASVSTVSGLSFSLNLNYSSSFSIGNTMPISKGIPYGDGWNLNIPTISIETEVFNNFSAAAYCSEQNTSYNNINFENAGVNALEEGDLYWYSPYINIPGIVSGKAIFKYIDAADNQTAVFVLNAFENHVEIRFNGNTWTVVLADGTRFTFYTATQSYYAPANKRVLFYEQGIYGNEAAAVQGKLTS